MEQKSIQKKIQLDGMSCISCEKRILTALKKMDGVEAVSLSYVNQLLTITYAKDKVKMEDITDIIQKLGYSVVKDKKSNMPVFLVVFIVALGFYMIIKHTIGFTFIPEIETKMSYVTLFLIGILTSVHCVAMCGGIQLSVCLRKSEKNTVVMPSFWYHIGRVISYTIIGGFVGALGSVFRISNMGSMFISVLAGVFMILMGLNLLQIFPWLRRFNLHIPQGIATKVNRGKIGKGPFVIGLLNGLMPCGPLQAMQLYALGTGSAITGAMSMFFFSIGTVPLLFVVSALGTLLSSKASKLMLKVSGVLVMVMGILMLQRGAAFVGLSMPSFSNQNMISQTTSEETLELDENEALDADKTMDEMASNNEEVQEITTYLQTSSYEPITVVVGKPVRFNIVATEDTLTGCNREVMIPEYNIRKELEVGDNFIEFTPTEVGEYGYSCWMGMITSSITVKE